MKKYCIGFTLALLIVILSGCTNFLNDVLFINSLSASKGESGYIDVNWIRDSHTDGDDNTTYADGYRVYRWTSNDYGSADIIVSSTTSTDYTDVVGSGPGSILSGRVYYYWVRSHGANFNHLTSSSWGYAMDSDSLKIYGTPGRYYHTVDTGESGLNEIWFDFEAQQGWTYHFETSSVSGGPPTLDITMEVFQEHIRNSDRVYQETLSAYGEYTWTCQESETFYLKVFEPTGNPFRLTVWHE